MLAKLTSEEPRKAFHSAPRARLATQLLRLLEAIHFLARPWMLFRQLSRSSCCIDEQSPLRSAQLTQYLKQMMKKKKKKKRRRRYHPWTLEPLSLRS